ncbi:MAG: hypothetical protein K8S97_02470 [Anaerolineae bacterium]|nr:hypothetical protein [Anaerolineae bacterium]
MATATKIASAPAHVNVVRRFAPGWPASVMGTAVLVVAFFVFEDSIPAAQALQVLFLALSGVLLAGVSVLWVLRWILHFDAVTADLVHPVSGAFFPTMPIALIVWGIALEKAGPQFMDEHTVHAIIEVLWVLGTVGIGVFALVILSIFFLRDDLKWHTANLGWLIPPVSALIVPVLGNSLAVIGADEAWGRTVFMISLGYLGLGTLLFVFVMGAVFTRHKFHAMLPAHLVPTLWVGIAPTAILTIIVIKMIKPLMLHFALTPATTDVLRTLAQVTAVGLWSFALFWLVFASVLTLVLHRRAPLTFALSWWAFTFPLGAFIVSTGVMYQAFGDPFFEVVGLTVLAGALIVWGAVAGHTVRGVADGSIFEGHDGHSD